MNKKNRTRQTQPRKLTAFERETERRRKEMIRTLSGGTIHSNNIPTSRLKLYIRDGVKVVMGVGKNGHPVALTKTSKGGFSNRNFWRGMMTKPSRVAA
jgi:hypothetical protein